MLEDERLLGRPQVLLSGSRLPENIELEDDVAIVGSDDRRVLPLGGVIGLH